MEYVLEAKKLEKNYGNKKILKNLSMHIKKGEIYGLIGKNGARKNNCN